MLSLTIAEGLLGLESEAQRAAAVQALEAVIALAHAQAGSECPPCCCLRLSQHGRDCFRPVCLVNHV